MTEASNDLWQELSTLADRFADVARLMLNASRELHAPGLLPPASLDNELTGLRLAFGGLRQRIARLALTLDIQPPTTPPVASIKSLAQLLEQITEAESRHSAAADTHKRALATLDRLLRLAHASGKPFPPLQECQTQARDLRASLADAIPAHLAEQAEGLAEHDHPFAYLVAMVEGIHQVNDDHWETLFDAVGAAFGKPLAAAAARSRIIELPQEHMQPAPTVEQPAPTPAPEPITPATRNTTYRIDPPESSSPHITTDDLITSIVTEALPHIANGFVPVLSGRKLGRAVRRKATPTIEPLETSRHPTSPPFIASAPPHFAPTTSPPSPVPPRFGRFPRLKTFLRG